MSTTLDLDFAFGNFNYICSRVSLTLCPLVGDADGIEPLCYSRNVKLVNTLIFQPCKSLYTTVALLHRVSRLEELTAFLVPNCGNQ